MKPIIIENAVSKLLFERFQHQIMSFDTEWHYMPNAAYRTDLGTSDESFSHTALFDGMKTSELLHLYESVLLCGLSKANIEPTSLIRLRCGMFMKNITNIVHTPHIDYDIPHMTGLLYINDVDGDTILYKEKYENKGLNAQDYYEMTLKRSVTEDIRISPKANTMVIFDGQTYHSSSSPTKDRRVVANFNFTI